MHRLHLKLPDDEHELVEKMSEASSDTMRQTLRKAIKVMSRLREAKKELSDPAVASQSRRAQLLDDILQMI